MYHLSPVHRNISCSLQSDRILKHPSHSAVTILGLYSFIQIDKNKFIKNRQKGKFICNLPSPHLICTTQR